MGRERIYLDANADTRVHPEVAERIAAVLTGAPGNPSSSHSFGAQARKLLEGTREAVAGQVGVAPRQVLFTSGGTEANALAIAGALDPAAPSPAHMIISAIEHPSVRQAAEALRRAGRIELDLLPVDPTGRVRPDQLAELLRPATTLVSVQAANHETGVVQPLDQIARVLSEHQLRHGQGPLLHVDAVQALGKLPWPAGTFGADRISISAHKIEGPKGVGALLLRGEFPLFPLQLGGRQERGRRGGTENLPGIVGLGAAVGRLAEDPWRSVAGHRDAFESRVLSALPRTHRHGQGAPRLPNTSNLGFPGLEGEVLLLKLDLAGVAASLGAACASGALEPSPVLMAMGLSRELASSSLRFSLGPDTTRAEALEAAERLITAARSLG